MKVLLTGAFGNIGRSTLDELLRQGHTVRCFVSRRKSHERTARRYEGKIELIQGDIRQSADLTKAVQDQEVIVHLAYMIPPPSEDNPLLAHSINIDGTRNLLRAARKLPNPPNFSSPPASMSLAIRRTSHPRAKYATRCRRPTTTRPTKLPVRRW